MKTVSDEKVLELLIPIIDEIIALRRLNDKDEFRKGKPHDYIRDRLNEIAMKTDLRDLINFKYRYTTNQKL